MMPLILAEAGALHTVGKIGGETKVRKHLENLGFNVGASVRIISKFQGNVIVAVKDTRVAISEEMARYILVIPRTEAQ